MSEHWPGTSGLPQGNATHRVVRGSHVRPEYLKAPYARAPIPEWTLYDDEAGVWSEADAKLLAEKHAPARIEPVQPGGFQQQVRVTPRRPRPRRGGC